MSSTPGLRRTATVLLLLYGASLAMIGFWPTPIDRPISGSLAGGLRWFREQGFHWLAYGVVESALNLLLFVPLGLLLAVVTAPRWWATVLCEIATSCLIELGQ